MPGPGLRRWSARAQCTRAPLRSQPHRENQCSESTDHDDYRHRDGRLARQESRRNGREPRYRELTGAKQRRYGSGARGVNGHAAGHGVGRYKPERGYDDKQWYKHPCGPSPACQGIDQ